MKALKLLFGAAAAGVVLQTFAAPDADRFMNPSLARIIFYHLPCALVTTIFLFVGVYHSVQYLRKREWHHEIKAAAANELGFILAILTMGTGVLFSKVQWGAWWQWDPRQTSFLLVLLIFGAYSAIRMGFENDEKRALAAAGYCSAAGLPSFFLIFVFPRLPAIQNQSFHPSQTAATGGFDRIYSFTIIEMLLVLLILTVWLYRSRVAAALTQHELELNDARLDDRGPSAATGVVRPVSLHVENGQPADGSPALSALAE